MDAIRARYQALARSADPDTRRLAAAQLRRLQPAPAAPRRATAAPEQRWAHVPLDALFEAAGNGIHGARDGQRVACGHEPLHASKSGRCVTITPARGVWYCRSCRRGGDAVTAVMLLRGCSAGAALRWLSTTYGPPAAVTRRRHRAPIRVEVVP